MPQPLTLLINSIASFTYYRFLPLESMLFGPKNIHSQTSYSFLEVRTLSIRFVLFTSVPSWAILSGSLAGR